MPNHELLYGVEPKLWSGTLKFEIRSNINFLSCLRNDFLLEILKASKFRNPLFFFFSDIITTPDSEAPKQNGLLTFLRYSEFFLLH